MPATERKGFAMNKTAQTFHVWGFRRADRTTAHILVDAYHNAIWVAGRIAGDAYCFDGLLAVDVAVPDTCKGIVHGSEREMLDQCPELKTRYQSFDEMCVAKNRGLQ